MADHGVPPPRGESVQMLGATPGRQLRGSVRRFPDLTTATGGAERIALAHQQPVGGLAAGVCNGHHGGVDAGSLELRRDAGRLRRAATEATVGNLMRLQ